MHFGAVALAVSLVFTSGNAFPQQSVPLNGTSSTVPQPSSTTLDSTSSTILQSSSTVVDSTSSTISQPSSTILRSSSTALESTPSTVPQSATTPLDSTPSTVTQVTTAPINSTSSTFPLTTTASTCWTGCRLNGPDYQQWVWRPMKFTETITYAPIITVINTRRNTTRTVTNTMGLPGNYTPQLINEAGTAICPVTLYDNTTTTLTYPQELGDYGTDYWLTLSECPENRRDVTLKSHPDFNEWYFDGTRTRLRQPGGFSTQSGVYDDVRGINWGCLTERDPVGEFSAFLMTAFPDEEAFPRCMHSVSVPVNYLTSAALLTVRSVSYEDDEDITSDPPSAQPTRSTAGVPISTGRTNAPTTTAQPGNPPESPAPSTEAPTVAPPAPETTVQAPEPDETSQPVQPPAAPEPSTVVGTVLPPAQETTVQAPEPDETSQAVQPPAAPEPSTVVGTVFPPASDTPVQVPGGADETSQPVQVVPIGSTSVTVVPTSIPTVIAGSSTSVPAVVVGSTTLTAGQTAVVDNTPIVVPTANSPATQGPDNDQTPPEPQSQPPAIIIGGSSTITLPTASPAAEAAPEPPTLTLADGQTVTPSGSIYIVSGQTLAPDSPALTLSGSDGSPPTIIALTTNAAGSSIVLIGGSSTVPYTAPAATTQKPALLQPPATAAATPPTLTLANGQLTLTPSGTAYVVSGTTLTPGAPPLTLNDDDSSSAPPTVIALTTDAAGSPVAVVVAGGSSSSTVAYVAAATPAPDSSNASPLVIFGTTVTPTGSGSDGGATYVFAGQTLTVGGTVTVGDAGEEKTTLVMTTDGEGRTVVVAQGGGQGASATRTSATVGEEGLGGFINSGLGGSARASSTTSTGSAGSTASASASASSDGPAATAEGGSGRVVGGEVFAVAMLLAALLVGGV